MSILGVKRSSVAALYERRFFLPSGGHRPPLQLMSCQLYLLPKHLNCVKAVPVVTRNQAATTSTYLVRRPILAERAVVIVSSLNATRVPVMTSRGMSRPRI